MKQSMPTKFFVAGSIILFLGLMMGPVTANVSNNSSTQGCFKHNYT